MMNKLNKHLSPALAGAAALLALSFLPAMAEEDVAFFEKTYGKKIVGVKPIGEYKDPDSFYREIAKQLGIYETAYKAVEKEFGWKKTDKTAVTAQAGRRDGGPWELMVVKVDVDPETGKPGPKTMHTMEMRMVFIDDKGKVSFPKDDEKPDGEKE